MKFATSKKERKEEFSTSKKERKEKVHHLKKKKEKEVQRLKKRKKRRSWPPQASLRCREAYRVPTSVFPSPCWSLSPAPERLRQLIFERLSLLQQEEMNWHKYYFQCECLWQIPGFPPCRQQKFWSAWSPPLECLLLHPHQPSWRNRVSFFTRPKLVWSFASCFIYNVFVHGMIKIWSELFAL